MRYFGARHRALTPDRAPETETVWAFAPTRYPRSGLCITTPAVRAPEPDGCWCPTLVRMADRRRRSARDLVWTIQAKLGAPLTARSAGITMSAFRGSIGSACRAHQRAAAGAGEGVTNSRPA